MTHEIEEVLTRLEKYMEPWQADEWLDIPNPALRWESPRAVIEAGRADLVLAIIDRWDSGAHI